MEINNMTEQEMNEAKPWDLLNNNNYVDESTRNGRYATCLDCDKLFKPTRTCKECGCFMSLKTWLKNASCPIGKWSFIPDTHE
jgi:hypothetical protein